MRIQHVKEQPGIKCKRLYRPFQLKELKEDGTFTGYGSVFGVKDSYDEIVVPGAFAKTIATHKDAGTMPKLLWQHNWDEVIGVWTVMKEDSHGLLMSGKLVLEVQRAMEAYALLKANALDGLSIGYIPKAWQLSEDDKDIIELTEIDLWETSLVTFPANPAARITDVRSLPRTIQEFEDHLRKAGFSANQAKAIAHRGFKPDTDAREEPDYSVLLDAINRRTIL